jgi:hypothetical protein
MAEFFASVDGWSRCHGAEKPPEPPSDERFEEMIQEIESMR